MRALVPLLYALKRIASSYALALCILAGFTASVALSICIPLYSTAVSTRMLSEELAKQPLPPYAFLFTFNGPLKKDHDRTEFTRLDGSFDREVPQALGLPALSRVRHVSVDTMQLLPIQGSGYSDPSSPLDWINLGSITGLETHLELIEGAAPHPTSAGQPVEVIVTQPEAEKLGLEVGDRFLLAIDKEEAGRHLQLAVPVRVSGVWRPKDQDRSFWFYQPSAYDQMVLTDEASFWSATRGATDGVPFDVTWYLVFDGSRFRVDQTQRLLSGIARVKAELASFESRPSLIYSPEESLHKYSAAGSQLTILLFAFALPVFALIFYLIFLLAHIAVERRKNEIALLRSRGTSRRRVVWTQLLQTLLLVAAAIPLGAALGMVFAQAMERTRTFLQFEIRTVPPVRISGSAVAVAAVAAACTLVGAILPSVRASRDTIVSYKRERARSGRRPAWERFYLDVALFVVTAYGYYTLRSRGTLMAFLSGGAVDDPFKNPFLFLVPTLFLVSVSLILLRLFPVLMEGIAGALRRLRGAPLVMAARAIARSPGSNRGLLLLVMLTVGLAGYTASMALTLDRHTTTDVYYSMGADLVLNENGAYAAVDATGSGDSTASTGSTTASGQTSGAPASGASDAERWEYPPISDYTELPGVHGGTRVGTYKAEVRWTGKLETGK
ncbi:MAG TPA: FtsX-like permease family protein, partial [Spirochaetia bacterium]|nr:FtsX-like permease family protein [Spirochaetia bacterium]